LEDALAYLAAQIRVTGCSGPIRQRLKNQSLRELAFFRLGTALSSTFAARQNGDEAALSAELTCLQSLIEACHRARDEALEHLEKSGVSTEMVYHLAFIEASLHRFEQLLELAFDPAIQLTRYAGFVALLARQNRARESVIDLLRQNGRLLTRKIVERSGETGEHYIARSRQEYGVMLKSAAGGGAIMAVTAWLKTILLAWSLPGLMQGIAASLNYSLGFVAIQLTGSTLATKQPANTAPALAARMHNVRDPAAIEQLVDEIVFLVRSQIASIVGNLALVAPSMLVLHFIVLWLTGREIMSPGKAVKAMHSISILGPSLIYAAFTGVLLWASSVAGAWAGNWFACNHIGEALEVDRRWIRVLGTTRAARLARFWTRNIAGLGGNISFGFMLGIIPELAQFAGIPLDIRHVTLSASFLTASVATLGVGVVVTKAFVLAVLGIAGIGLMNLTVSFSLAMFVATRACDIQSPERHTIYAAVARRAMRQPLSFLFPTNGAREVTAALPDKSGT
jgi:site-specific recombinase